MKHDNAHFDYYLTTIPGLNAKDIIEIKRAIKNRTPIILSGAQMSGRTTLAKVLCDLGATVYDDHVNCMVINMKASIDRNNMDPNAYDNIIKMIDEYDNAE